MQNALSGYLCLTDGHGIGVGLVVGIRSVFIDDGAISGISVEETQWQFYLSGRLVGDATDRPPSPRSRRATVMY